MWSQRDPSMRKSGVGNVIVKNLDKSIDSKTLHDTFSEFGSITSCRVKYDEEGVSRGYGFVQFSTEEEAQNALKSANKRVFQGTDKEIIVLKHKPIKELIQKINEYKKNFVNVYVKNVPKSYTNEQFQKLFKDFGAITSCTLMFDNDGNSKGFGYVCFKLHESAQQAVEALNKKELEPNTPPLFLARHQKRAEREEEKRRFKEQRKREHNQRMQNLNLYIKNIDESWTENELKTYFQSFGEIKSCKIMRDNREVSKGFGFICFSSPEESQRAVTEMHNKYISGKPLYVQFHQSKEVRRQFLENQKMSRPFYSPYPHFMSPYPRPMRPVMPPYMYSQQRQPTQQRPMNRAPTSAPPTQRTPRPQQNMGAVAPRNMNPHPANRAPPMAGQGGPKNNVRYNSNVVNMGRNQEKAVPEPQKRDIGDKLYYTIAQSHPEFASKVTGMLLEIPFEELINLLNNPMSLEEKVNEAISLIQSNSRS